MALIQEDIIITEFLKSIGPWKNHIVIGGGFALFVYKLYLSNQKLANPPVTTRDIDSLISRKIPIVSDKSIENHLKEAGFNHFFKDLNNPATEAYVKDIDGTEIEIEFLTDNSSRSHKNKNIVIAGVVAQPLSYISLSLQRTLEFQTFSKITGNVVTPDAWVFHKGLTFTKRKSLLKAIKDLYGIWYVLSQLGSLSNQTLDQFKILAKQHPKWFKSFHRNLEHWLENATPNDWSKLEDQDPSGKLRKLNFEHIITMCLT